VRSLVRAAAAEISQAPNFGGEEKMTAGYIMCFLLGIPLLGEGMLRFNGSMAVIGAAMIAGGGAMFLKQVFLCG
jgi:hypothetical protein